MIVPLQVYPSAFIKRGPTSGAEIKYITFPAIFNNNKPAAQI